MVYFIPDRAKHPRKINGVYCLIFDEAELELGRQRLRRRERNVDLALQGHMVGIWGKIVGTIHRRSQKLSIVGL